MKRAISALAQLVVLLLAANAAAEWRVEIGSKTVDPGQTGVTVGFTVYWDLDVVGLVIPVIVRELNAGSFWTGQLPYDSSCGGPSHGVTWNWSNPNWAFEMVEPGLGCDPAGDVGYDGVSPDHFLVAAQHPEYSHRTPAEPTGREVLVLEFDVTETPGEFEFDTACYSRYMNSIFMIDYSPSIIDHGPKGTGEVTFNKGVITIGGCDCGVWGDVTGEGDINPVDVTYMVQFVYFQNDMRVQPPNCPLEAGDMAGCDGQVNPQDVTFYVQYVYFQNNMFCPDPCGP